jgi:hypothetical protein
MKAILTFCISMAFLANIQAQESISDWWKRWTKGDLLFAAAGYQIPLYDKDGKRFTDPLVSYSRQQLLFVPMISTNFKKGFGLDFRLSYLQSTQWLKEMENNFRQENPGMLISLYPSNGSATMRVWSMMIGPSYRIQKARSIWSFNVLGGIGNQPLRNLSVDIKTPGSNDLVTWDILNKTDPGSPAVWLYQNIYMASAGVKYIYRLNSRWGLFASCDLQRAQRFAHYDVTLTEQHSGRGSEYTVNVKKPGFAVTPGIGVVLLH